LALNPFAGEQFGSVASSPPPTQLRQSVPVFSQDSGYEWTDDYSTTRSYADTGDMDCTDFSSQDEAQAFFEDEGGPDEDYHNLDRDGDGVVCETLP
jgi:micrococcal nuclease